VLVLTSKRANSATTPSSAMRVRHACDATQQQ
jgi:hypothetical protein